MKKIKNIIYKLKKMSLAKKLTVVYFCILIILMVAFLLYIRSSLIMYESNQIDTYINNFIENPDTFLKREKASKSFDFSKIKVSEFENDEAVVKDGYTHMVKNTEVTYKLKEQDESNKQLIYTIFSDKQPIFDITINKGKVMHRMGLLTFNMLEIDNINDYFDRGLLYYDIIVPSNFKVKINGNLLTEEHIKSINSNDEFGTDSYDVFPNNVTYQVNNLLYKPDIIVINNNDDAVVYDEKNNIITSTEFYATDDKNAAMERLVEPFDVLPLAEKWSLFLTDDLNGNKNGFGTLEKYLIKDSYMWDVAHDWGTGIDINFVSSHVLKNPIFTNEQVSDYVVYNEKAFSCLVHLEKNMIVSGKTKIDVMNDRLYFIYYDNSDDGVDNPTWKLVNMKAVTIE